MQRIEVSLKSQLPDARGRGLVKDIYDLGITSITNARVHDVYYIRGKASPDDINTVCYDALTDPLIHDFHIGLPDYSNQDKNCQAYEVAYNPGVTDPIEESILKGIRDLGIDSITGVKTATRYELYGKPAEPELQIICSRLLVNPTVQHIITGQMADSFEIPEYRFELKTVDILSASPARLSCIAGELGFSEAEIKAILKYYRQMGRNPTDAELETLAQTWSEHCGHKTFKARYDFNGTTID
ncbi:MAG: phosphoribosylformylglycinamidine synthase subunit PurS, partial [Limnochordia bacterium]|nr:phosphoribosylformylglycinamidine synthase subunit PurS [Limnochordia bacterium]